MLTPAQVDGLGIALNEADFHEVAVDQDACVVGVHVSVLARDEDGDEDGDEAADPRRTLRLTGVARLLASYRAGTWDDATAPVVPLDVDGLVELLRRYGGGPVYGWEFVDSTRESRRWERRPSLDLTLAGAGGHRLSLFQDFGRVHHLDLAVWFDDLEVRDGAGEALDLDAFIADGRRRSAAARAGEHSAHAPGIVALGGGDAAPRWWHRFRRTRR